MVQHGGDTCRLTYTVYTRSSQSCTQLHM